MGAIKKRGVRNGLKSLGLSSWANVVLFAEMQRMEEKGFKWCLVMSLVLDRLSLRGLLDIHVEMLPR